MIAYHAAFDSRKGGAPFLGYDMYIIPAPPPPAALPTPEPFGPQAAPVAAAPAPSSGPSVAQIAVAGILIVGAVALVASTNAVWRKR